MSPVGGVGINLAVADAVAAAAHWQARYAAAPSSTRQLARVQAAVAVSAGQPAKPALVVRIADKVPALRTAAGYAIAIGPLPEHVPEFARR